MSILIVIIALSLIIIIHELGHFLSAKYFKMKVEEFGIGFPPRLIGKKIGETIYSINALPLGGFVKIFGENEDKKDEHENPKKDSFSGQSVGHRLVVILAGVIMNIILGWIVLTIVFAVGTPEHLIIGEVTRETPAAIAGLESGDVILGIRYEDEALNDPVNIKDFIDFANKTAGKEITLTIDRGGKELSLSFNTRDNPPRGEGPIGVSLMELGNEPQSFGRSIIEGTKATVSILIMITQSFWGLIKGIVLGTNVLDSVSGPIGIVRIAAKTSALGLVYLLELIGFISLNLAILNLIPFPALDGGRAIFLLVEKIKGSPISDRIQMWVNGIGFALLILLMVVVTVKDILRIVN